MNDMLANPQIPYELSLLSDVEVLERRASRGEIVRAADVNALLARYGTAFAQLPRYLQEAIDRIDLAE